MGIILESKRHSAYMGLSGFARFRNLVAQLAGSEDFYNHYLLISDFEIRYLRGKERETYFKSYDKKIIYFIEHGHISSEIANFLYAEENEGSIDRNQALKISKFIKNCDDDIIYGYPGSNNPSKMKDMKKIFSDKTKVKWS